jgi:hypothetical protein
MALELVKKIGGPMLLSTLLDTVIGLTRNENNYTKQEGSMFTYTSILPKGEWKKNIQLMDTNLKLILAITATELKNIVGKSKIPDWKDIVSSIQQNILFEKCEDTSKYGIRTYSRDSFNFLKFDGEPDENTIKEVTDWFIEVLQDIDPELINISGVFQNETFKTLASIVSSTGSHVSSISTAIRRSDYEELTIADVGLIRYPSFNNPKTKIFRMRIKSWRNCQRILAFESNKNGLTVEIDSREYAPREDVIQLMRERVLTEKDVKTLCENVENTLIEI